MSGLPAKFPALPAGGCTYATACRQTAGSTLRENAIRQSGFEASASGMSVVARHSVRRMLNLASTAVWNAMNVTGQKTIQAHLEGHRAHLCRETFAAAPALFDPASAAGLHSSRNFSSWAVRVPEHDAFASALTCRLGMRPASLPSRARLTA